MTEPRLYDAMLRHHLAEHRQMAFVSGPRQVGKTTTCRAQSTQYLNWDNTDDRQRILAGPGALAEHLGLTRLSAGRKVALFDELHKYARWKALLKGFFDTYADDVRIIVTGSSRMDVFRRGGDSLMGRYFPYRMHPFSVAELITQALPDPTHILRSPSDLAPARWLALWEHGGFPEPFLKCSAQFSRRWGTLRAEQLTREDIRDFTRVQELGQLAALAHLLRYRSAQQLVFQNLANEVRISTDTARRWVEALRQLHLGFLVRPWFRNVSRSLRKEPKWFLRDWSGIEDEGSRAETFVACHLLKAVEGWTDMGLGQFELAYLRDKERREVDFVVIRDEKPWFLVETKLKQGPLSPALAHYQKQVNAPFAFQVALQADFVDANCFEKPRGPLGVPAKTLLSQLL
ncbi:MAG: AAA family ATPase [Polyangiaceae bacterium]|nr:AAA family ATPase [Polyangiaceae bacterium]